MADETLRQLERDWDQDPAALERAISARRRMGIPVPRRFLMARRLHSVKRPDAYSVFYYAPRSSYDQTLAWKATWVPEHWLWGVRIEHCPDDARRATWRSLLAQHAVPAVSLNESDDALLEALEGLPLRALCLNTRTTWSARGWQAVLALSDLEALDLRARAFRPTVETFAELARLPNLTSLHLEGELLYSTKLESLGPGLAELPRLTHLSLKQVSVGDGRDLAALRDMRYLEELELQGPLRDADLAAVASCPALRTLRLYKVDGITNAGLAELRGTRLEQVHVSDCPGIRAGHRVGCPRCGGTIPPPPPEPAPSRPSLPPTGGDYEWVQVTTSSSQTCPSCTTVYRNTSQTTYDL
ncbi:MAG: hypothetical protein R3F62_04390 [Planctomycetota bacterium]